MKKLPCKFLRTRFFTPALIFFLAPTVLFTGCAETPGLPTATTAPAFATTEPVFSAIATPDMRNAATELASRIENRFKQLHANNAVKLPYDGIAIFRAARDVTGRHIFAPM